MLARLKLHRWGVHLTTVRENPKSRTLWPPSNLQHWESCLFTVATQSSKSFSQSETLIVVCINLPSRLILSSYLPSCTL